MHGLSNGHIYNLEDSINSNYPDEKHNAKRSLIRSRIYYGCSGFYEGLRIRDSGVAHGGKARWWISLIYNSLCVPRAKLNGIGNDAELQLELFQQLNYVNSVDAVAFIIHNIKNLRREENINYFKNENVTE
jgi:hypothetical protein